MILRILLAFALLKCSYSEELSITCDYKSYDKSYVCLINGITIKNDTKVVEIVGNHEFGKIDNDVTKVTILNSNLYELPTQIWTTFGYLKILLAPRTGLKKVESLDSCAVLEELDLSWNELEELPALIKCYELKKLDLSWNKLGSFKENQLQHLGSLMELNLAHNKITKLDGNFLAPLENLNVLIMSSNQLRTLSKSVFDNLVNLETLEISQNPLQSIENECFVNAGALKSLIITETELEVLPVDVFKGLENLQSLSIADNKYLNMDSVTFQSLKKLVNLRSLSLPRNNIKSINDDTFWDMKNLRTLDLEGNLLETLNPNWFDNSQELSELSLKDNLIMDISEFSFKSLRKLTSLNLGHNSLIFIARSIFENATQIREMRLDGNELSGIFFDVFSGLRRLRYLFLDDNLLGIQRRLFNFTELTDLELLGLSKNELKEFEPNILLNATKIKGLYLQNNNISVIPAQLFSQNVQLNHVHLENNSISVVQPGAFENLPNLDYLGLNNNLCVNQNFNSDGDVLKKALTDCNKNAWTCLNVETGTCLIENVSYLNQSNSVYIFQDRPIYQRIIFKNSNLTEIPEAVWSFWTAVNVESTQMERLGDPVNCMELGELRAGFNRITEIPNGIRSCGFLRFLDLRGNQIHNIEALPGLIFLTQLNLNDNKLKGIPRLSARIENLSLENNLIEYNSTNNQSLDYLKFITGLRVVNLNKNQITEINQNLFSPNVGYKEIHLSNNQISRIENGSFNLLYLQIIDLRSNDCIDKYFNETETIRNIYEEIGGCLYNIDNGGDGNGDGDGDGGSAERTSINFIISVVMLTVLYSSVKFVV